MGRDDQVYQEIVCAVRHLEDAYKLAECKFCKEDILLCLNAAKDLEQIADFARSLADHPHRLKAIRVLGANLDKIHALAALVILMRNRLIRKLLEIGSHERD